MKGESLRQYEIRELRAAASGCRLTGSTESLLWAKDFDLMADDLEATGVSRISLPTMASLVSPELAVFLVRKAREAI